MALVANARRVPGEDPTFPLVQDLTDFKHILTDEEMQMYQANASKPGASSIIEFVRIVDESKSKTTMRCMGYRLCTFLDKTQQFAGVADTFISFNPTVAALVWGSVKMAILTANNVASYFEKVTGLIMSIGKLCPSYEKFGGLYSGCIELQKELCDFYAIIIRMCIKIIEVSRRQTVKQMISSLFIPFENGLDECDEKECEQVIPNLTRLRQCDTSSLKIFITSRPNIEAQLFSAGRPRYKISVTEENVKSDMEIYIDVMLSRLLEEGKLKLRDGSLIATISQALRDGSDGM
ncbi:hypothetical protein N7463_001385 [Penicillium fimorum]|uniref:DUF7708 domain-containing protein n=1 Tax=Penicillium fimorum TaxID=1882269 RepID=A0A9X0CCQ1_9EURO|nr:hypothetical protein N7463_001385 [Penicillium fimorum]